MSADHYTILIVDDESYILPTLKVLLSGDYTVLTASSADDAEIILTSTHVDILLTDQKMPRRTGIQLLEWAREHSPQTLRLLMTGYSELDEAIDAINRGNVYYYLLKPWRTEDLFQILRNAADKVALERSKAELLAELKRLNRDLEKRVADRTRELQEANLLLEQRAREMERLALTDSLTGLFNRRAIEELARFELKRHARYPCAVSIGYIDVDHFKQINTEYLLTGGDEVLKGLARVLVSTLREVDSVGRIGGEEFLVIASDTGFEGAMVLAERIRSSVEATPIRVGTREAQITVSVGFAVAEIGVNVELPTMVELAAAALARAKASGRNRIEVSCVQAGSEVASAP